MFEIKQFLKLLVLPPSVWLILLLVVLLFWRRRWARPLLLATFVLVFALHSGYAAYALRSPLESRYAALRNPATAAAYQAIVVLTSQAIPASDRVPFPTIDEAMFRRLDEALRLYRLRPVPIIVSGGHVDPFTPDEGENEVAVGFLARWGVPAEHLIGEARSRDTFESAQETAKILKDRGWKRYLLVTSALHMPRSMMVFGALAPEPLAAPADFLRREPGFGPLEPFPSVSAARSTSVAIHEYLGLANYSLRLFLCCR